MEHRDKTKSEVVKVVHIVPHTHFDREWYQPFEYFRYQLANLFTDLLDHMDKDPNYCFTFDGQSIVIEDYLDLHPDAERIKNQVQNEKLIFGPWYVQPDLFLISGESIVRNLQLGIRIASEYGDYLKVGYVPDIFGHISQLPEIFKLFDINHLVFWRGVPMDMQDSEFYWQSPSGHKALVTFLFESYSNGVYLPLDSARFREEIQSMLKRYEPHQKTPYHLLMNGTDHTPPQLELSTLIQELNQDDLELTTLGKHCAKVQEYIKEHNTKLQVLEGELRDPTRAPLLGSVYSSRTYLKQMNVKTERLHEDYIYPLYALTGMLGMDDITEKINRSTRMYLVNHSHDCICGCSADEVHEDMVVRFRSAQELGAQILEQICQYLGNSLNIAGSPAALSRSPVLLINPHSYAFTGLVDVTFELGTEHVHYQVQAGNQFLDFMPHAVESKIIHDYGIGSYHLGRIKEMIQRFEGQNWYPCSYELIDDELHVLCSRAPSDFDYDALLTMVTGIKMDDNAFLRVLVKTVSQIKGQLWIDELDPYSTLVLELVKAKAGTDTEFSEALLFERDEMDYSIKDGQHRLTESLISDRKLVLDDLFHIVDDADRGDEYNFDPIEGSEIHAEFICGKCIAKNAIYSDFELFYRLDIPEGLDDSRDLRSDTIVPHDIRVLIRVFPHRIDYEVFVDNQARDHRLRVHFSLPDRFTSLYSSSPFQVVERPYREFVYDISRAEQIYPTVPQQEFSTLQGGDYLLTLVNDGLPEIELINNEQHSTLALTLFRSVGYLSRGDLKMRRGQAGPSIETPGAQCLGPNSYRFSLLIHFEADWFAIFAKAKSILSPPRTIISAGLGSRVLVQEYVAVDAPELVVTAIEKTGICHSIRMRVVNYSDQIVEAKISSKYLHIHSTPFVFQPWEIKEIPAMEASHKTG